MGNQHDFFKGTMKIRVSGKLIAPFLQACTKRGCMISNISWVREDEILMTIRLNEWTTIRKLRKKYRCKVFILEGKGMPFIQKRMFQRTSLLMAFFIAVIFIFLLANTLWSIRVEGLTPELQANVEQKLKSYGVYPGRLTFGMNDPNEIQTKLLDDLPDLLWIGVNKRGTSYHLYGVEKIRHDTDLDLKPADLVAQKKGMIVKTFITQGRPLVEVNQIVKKGQRLAAGQLVEDEDIYVHAEGEVVAETWYKVEQNLPLQQVIELTDGTMSKEYRLRIGQMKLPLWGWWGESKKDLREEETTKKMSVLGWNLPVQIQVSTFYQIDHSTMKLSREKLQRLGIDTGRQSLKQTLEADAEIMNEKVLHQRSENGKVKLILLFKVHENIAMTKYISQGD
ncbi:sporulation protein YqfD [Halobacillus yeomjeoni]|uniref:sporulation protein YqfD n=1 Tax=Halobacillus yeomjeoni TaxID=311194 RepID=UPI0021E54659|nr:sporulation protein YqfD [Halobacillus yeomjeoni]